MRPRRHADEPHACCYLQHCVVERRGIRRCGRLRRQRERVGFGHGAAAQLPAVLRDSPRCSHHIRASHCTYCCCCRPTRCMLARVCHGVVIAAGVACVEGRSGATAVDRGWPMPAGRPRRLVAQALRHSSQHIRSSKARYLVVMVALSSRSSLQFYTLLSLN